MPQYLDVPFNENEEAKALGAMFDNTVKRWYCPEHLHFELFLKWQPGNRQHKVMHEPPKGFAGFPPTLPCMLCGERQVAAAVMHGKRMPLCQLHYDEHWGKMENFSARNRTTNPLLEQIRKANLARKGVDSADGSERQAIDPETQRLV